MPMQDVTPPNRDRSIRNIPVPEGRKHFEPAMPQDENDGGGRKKGGRGRLILWGGIIIVACIVIGAAVSFVFAGASVTVYPRTASVAPPTSVLAGLNAPVGSLAFKRITFSEEASKTVAANGTTAASTSAQGTVTIYNTYGTASQELVANTRFEAPDGKIYRIHQGVVVPGTTKNADGSVKAGTITATIYADAAGADYNKTSETRFTIPGFKNTARYTKFYAIAPSISGGFVGTQPAVSQTDLALAQTDLKSQLQNKIDSGVASHVPDGYLLVPGTMSAVYDDLKNTAAGTNSAALSQTVTINEAVVASQDLASAIARLGVQGYNGESVDFANPSGITLSVASGTPYTDSATSLTIGLSGNANLVWQFDEGAVQQALAGKPKSQFDQIISTFAPGIAKATASLRPFWKTTFPENPSDIKIKTETTS